MNRNTYPLRKLNRTQPTLCQENSEEYRSGSLICTRVAAVTFNNRQEGLVRLSPGETRQERREPNNFYDPNAIRVEHLNRQQISYPNRSMAAELAPFFKAHKEPARGQAHRLTGAQGNGFSLDVIIGFYDQ